MERKSREQVVRLLTGESTYYVVTLMVEPVVILYIRWLSLSFVNLVKMLNEDFMLIKSEF